MLLTQLQVGFFFNWDLSTALNVHAAYVIEMWLLYYQGFSLKSWLESKGINGSVTTTLPVYLEHLLLEDRGIANMLKGEPCNRSDLFYNGSIPINGWTTGIFDIICKTSFKYI